MSRKGPEGGKLGKKGKGGARGRGKGEGERDIAAGLPGWTPGRSIGPGAKGLGWLAIDKAGADMGGKGWRAHGGARPGRRLLYGIPRAFSKGGPM